MSRASWNYVAQHLGQGVGAGIQKVTEKYLEDEKKKKALEVYEDPNSTPVQKVMALESISPGKGANIYETIFKEDQAKKAAANSAIINDELNGIAPPPQQDVGQRAEVGAIPKIGTQSSPVEMANNLQGPGSEDIGPIQNPGVVGTQPVQPETLRMIQQAEQQRQQNAQPPVNQNVAENVAAPTGAAIESIPTPRLQQLLQQAVNADDKGAAQRIGTELKRRDVQSKNAATVEAANITAGINQLNKDKRFSLDVNTPYNKRIADKKASTPVRMRAVDMAESAVRSGDVGAFSLNHIADVLKIPSLKTEEGAKLDQAIKTNLIGTLSETSAKSQNLFLEKVALDAFARPGNKESANLIKLLAVKTELQLEELETNVYDQILAEDIEKFGFEQPYIQLRVEKALKPAQNELIKGAAWKAVNLSESGKSYDKLAKRALSPVEKGTPLTERMGQILVEKAGGDIDKWKQLVRQLGYTIYSKADRERYESQ